MVLCSIPPPDFYKKLQSIRPLAFHSVRASSQAVLYFNTIPEAVKQYFFMPRHYKMSSGKTILIMVCGKGSK
jgi:hypothetical protein